ncbi:MAG TPA: 5-oxoprolinase subunit PxpA [Lacibacter sp.]|nr:5-oxoprolinase subunit PxpA [Lacibacter sp.]HMO90413.1 5-oxoprolinase subunit PxpA [Lacibacter sp.]HMP87869.1 5-oxoprolinase subunit PxpA [Lacibacter sp.]
MQIDLNSDLGEGYPLDRDLMPLISSANIACGAHAGDAATMQQTIALCLEHGVAIGAHPSWPDRCGFGRHPMLLPTEEVYALIRDQLQSLADLAPGGKLHHVKPHGALYNQSAADPELATIIARAVYDTDPGLLLLGLSGSLSCSKARELGLQTAAEVFADRRYEDDGSLVPRSQPDALIKNPQEAAAQALRLAQEGTVITRSGKQIRLQADTICIHGDEPNALALAQAIRFTLQQHGIAIQALSHH